MLCELKYYEKSAFRQKKTNEIVNFNSNSTLNFTAYNSTFNVVKKVLSTQIPKKIIASPHVLEYILAFWIFSFFIEECKQFVSKS